MLKAKVQAKIMIIYSDTKKFQFLEYSLIHLPTAFTFLYTVNRVSEKDINSFKVEELKRLKSP